MGDEPDVRVVIDGNYLWAFGPPQTVYLQPAPVPLYSATPDVPTGDLVRQALMEAGLITVSNFDQDIPLVENLRLVRDANTSAHFELWYKGNQASGWPVELSEEAFQLGRCVLLVTTDGISLDSNGEVNTHRIHQDMRAQGVLGALVSIHR